MIGAFGGGDLDPSRLRPLELEATRQVLLNVLVQLGASHLVRGLGLGLELGLGLG